MEKKTLFLKWARVVIVLLGVMAFALGGNFHVVRADTIQSCELSWFGSGPKLNMGTVPQDIQTALSGTNPAHLTACTNSAVTSCTLVQNVGGTVGDTALDYSNIQSTSGTLIQSLQNDHIALNCIFPSSANTAEPSGSVTREWSCSQNDNDTFFDILNSQGGWWDCFSGAGTLNLLTPVGILDVMKVCTGNYTGSIVLDVGNGNSEKYQFLDKSTCTNIPGGYTATQLTINPAS